MTTPGSAAALVLAAGLRTMLTVSFVPLGGNVALLDTTTPAWLLEVDSGSSAEDQCWAMLDVLRVVSFGAQAAEFAQAAPRLRLVAN